MLVPLLQSQREGSALAAAGSLASARPAGWRDRMHLSWINPAVSLFSPPSLVSGTAERKCGSVQLVLERAREGESIPTPKYLQQLERGSLELGTPPRSPPLSHPCAPRPALAGNTSGGS